MSATMQRSIPLNVLTGARFTIGALALLAPRIGARIFRMDVDGTPAVAMGRMFGIRNAALAAGLLRLDTLSAPRTFMGINILIDVVDALALVDAGRRREIEPAGAALATGVALAAVGLGAAGLAAMSRTPRLSAT
jgi:hypothetical protein